MSKLLMSLLLLLPGTIFGGDNNVEINWTNLEAQMSALISEFEGDAGVFVKHFPSGYEIAINADAIFPTASMIKVPIMATLFNKIHSGQLDYGSEYVYTLDRLYAGSDILGSFKAGEKITLSRLVMLMITMSDNTASLWCQELAGTGTDINLWLETNGFTHTRVNSGTTGRHSDWEAYGWGQTTPREMSQLLTMIYRGEAVSKSASEEMYRVMSGSFWDGEALSEIPPTVQVASKQGAVSQSRSEVVLVNAPSGDYVFAILTNNQTDKSWAVDNVGYVLIRQVSALLWSTFEPASDWIQHRDSTFSH